MDSVSHEDSPVADADGPDVAIHFGMVEFSLGLDIQPRANRYRKRHRIYPRSETISFFKHEGLLSLRQCPGRYLPGVCLPTGIWSGNGVYTRRLGDDF